MVFQYCMNTFCIIVHLDFQNITCRDDFVSLNGTCQARCGQTSILSSATTLVNKVLRYAGAISSVLGGGAFLIASVIRYKEM